MEFSRLENDDFFYGALTCHVESMNIMERGEIMNPNWIDNDNRVRKLKIFFQTVKFLPKFTVLLAQRLEIFQAHSCHLKIVSKEDLQQFPRLKFISLENNDLEWLNGDLFDFNPKLESVWFCNNKLKYIEENMFASLTKLQWVDFSYADCIKTFISDPKNELPGLKEELKTSCKDESTKSKMLEERSKTASETTFTILSNTFSITRVIPSKLTQVTISLDE